jgi:phosphate transport system protein
VDDTEVLKGRVVEMTSRAQIALGDATRALFGGNSQLAQKVIADDHAIDDLQRRIEQQAISTISAHGAGSELRELVSTIRLVNDVERIGDLAKNVAKRVIAIGEQSGSLKAASSLMPLASRVREQLWRAGAAYRQRDDAAALEVWRWTATTCGSSTRTDARWPTASKPAHAV